MYRAGGVRSITEAGDRVLYAPRDPEEVRAMFLQMRATRDATRRGEHEAGWRLDSNRGAMIREAAWREAGRRDAAMGGEPMRAAALQEGAFRSNALHPMARAIGEGAQESRGGADEGGAAALGVSSGDRGVLLASPEECDKYYRERSYGDGASGAGYFGETPGGNGQRILAVRALAMDGVHTGDGRHRSVRDLVSQLWFDDFDEATAGARGLCDITVPSHPQAAANREVIGATPSVLEGLERLVRSGSPNAAYHACEALSQLSFRNARNAQRIMDARSPDLPAALAALLGLFRHPGQAPPRALAALDSDSAYDLRAAVLRVLNNCACGSARACADMAEHGALMDAVEEMVREAWRSPALAEAARSAGDEAAAADHAATATDGPVPPLAVRADAPVPLLMALDAGVGLLSHLATHTHSRMVLLRRKVAEEILLEMVVSSEKLECPPEQYLCTLAGAVEVVIKLVWDDETPPFIPTGPILHTIVWTLVCALDGVMWAGITWSALSRVQALAKLSAVDELKVPLIDLHLVEALVRLLDQWTSEQGVLVLEYALLCLLNLLTVEEARFRLYLTGVYRPLRSIVLGDDGASAGAREKAVLCAWLLFEWQVDKLETLDGKVKELMAALETEALERVALEDEYAQVRAELLAELEAAAAARDRLFGENEVLRSELAAAQQALAREQGERAVDAQVAGALVASLQGELAARDAQLESLQVELLEARQCEEYAKQQAVAAAADARMADAKRGEAELSRSEAAAALDKTARLAEMRYHEMVVEGEARQRAGARVEALESELAVLGSAREILQAENVALRAELTGHAEATARSVAAAEAAAAESIAAAQERAAVAGELLCKAMERDAYLSRRAMHLEADCMRLFNARRPAVQAPGQGHAPPAGGNELGNSAEDDADDSSAGGGTAGTARQQEEADRDAVKGDEAAAAGGKKRVKVLRKPGSGLWLDAWSTLPEVQRLVGTTAVPPPQPAGTTDASGTQRRVWHSEVSPSTKGPGGFAVQYSARRWQSWASEYGPSVERARPGPRAIYDEADATLRGQMQLWLEGEKGEASAAQRAGVLRSAAPVVATASSPRSGRKWLSMRTTWFTSSDSKSSIAPGSPREQKPSSSDPAGAGASAPRSAQTTPRGPAGPAGPVAVFGRSADREALHELAAREYTPRGEAAGAGAAAGAQPAGTSTRASPAEGAKDAHEHETAGRAEAIAAGISSSVNTTTSVTNISISSTSVTVVSNSETDAGATGVEAAALTSDERRRLRLV
jgi:hypothetical protein